MHGRIVPDQPEPMNRIAIRRLTWLIAIALTASTKPAAAQVVNDPVGEFAIRSGFSVMFIGALGFLGFGAPPPTPEWGLMINEGRSHIAASLWPVLAPATAMAVLVVAINLVTDGLSRVIGGAGPLCGERS